MLLSPKSLLPALAAGCALLGAVPAAAQGPIEAPRDVLDHFSMERGTVQSLVLPGERPSSFEVRVQLGGTPRVLALRSYDIRTPDFRLLVHDAHGIHQVPTPPSVTYRGEVRGVPESLASASLVDGQLTAMVRIGDEIWGIEPASKANRAYPRAWHFVYNAKHQIWKNVSCGLHTPVAGKPPAGGSGPAAVSVAEIAIDADRDYYVRNGSNVTRTQNAVTTVMNGVDAIYQRDTNIQYKITQIIVRTVTVYTTSNMGTLLRQFQNQWNFNHGGVKRDLAHLFTGKGSFSGVIGIAYLSVVCRLSSAYGVSKAFGSHTANVGLVAHETGHNWSAPHCNSNPPCYIMCSALGGCNRSLSLFGNYSKGWITGYARSASCLGSGKPPVISSINPNSVRAFEPPQVTLTGSNFTGASTLRIGFQTVAFNVQNDNTITFVPPAPPALGPFSVSVSNSSGTSNSVSLTFTKTSPPRLKAPSIGVGNFAITYDFAADANDSWFLIVAVNDNSTFNFLGSTVLRNFVLLGSGTLNAAGIGQFKFTPPAGFPGAVIYSQGVFLGGGGSRWGGATNIGKTTMFL